MNLVWIGNFGLKIEGSKICNHLLIFFVFYLMYGDPKSVCYRKHIISRRYLTFEELVVEMP